MNDFSIWFHTGFTHILDFAGYDHILFVTLLTLGFQLSEWKKLLIVITAFTVGHSISLALSVIGQLHLPQPIIEFAIALSILFTAIQQLLNIKKNQTSPRLIYTITALFGLIHGLGFSFLLREMLGASHNLFLPLLYFNLGLEAGQLIIVSVVVVFSLFLAGFGKWTLQIFKIILICSIALIALKVSVERFLDLWQPA